MTIIPPTRLISPRNLREIFEKGNYLGRLAAGRLIPRIEKDRHPSSPKAAVPFCTRSQSIAYLDENGDEVAKVHQYLLPNGTLGASGLPDPKRLLFEGVLYVAWWTPDRSDG
jgi:hypothetical protein